MAPAFKKSDQDRSRSGKSAKYFATVKIKINFTHSDGWKCPPPGILIQRRAPIYLCPNRSTAINEASEAKYTQ